MDITTLPKDEGKRFDYLENIVKKGMASFVEVGTALMIIKKEKLYCIIFSTFEEYCRIRWGFGHSYTNYLMRSARTVENIKTSTTVEVLPTHESQLRPLTHLEPEQQKKVWKKAVETAPKGKVTAKHVQETVEEMTSPQKDVRHEAEEERVEPLEEDYGPIEDTIVIKQLKKYWGFADRFEREIFLLWIQGERISCHDR